MTDSPVPSQKLLTFKSGGWVLVVAGLLVVGIAAAFFIHLSATGWQAAIGDGQRVESYGFDLSACRVPREWLVAAGIPKDGRPVLTDPPTVSVADHEAAAAIANGRYRLLVSSDLVVGVEVGGTARAYPIRMLNWHEIVNDSLGEMPIAVTYSPMTDGVAVFDRRVAGETLHFGVSGLLYQSNLVMYDQRPDAIGESLWGQLPGASIAGPAAAKGHALTVLPAQLVTWGEWKLRRPDSTVMVPPEIAAWAASDRTGKPAFSKQYKRDPFGPYFSGGKLLYPTAPLPDASAANPPRELMARVVIVGTPDGAVESFALADIVAKVDADGVWRAEVGGVPVAFAVSSSEPQTAWVAPLDGQAILSLRHCRWFAWYAISHAKSTP